jgi:hypothetical protein
MEEITLTSDETLPKFDVNQANEKETQEEKNEEAMEDLPDLEIRTEDEIDMINKIKKYKKIFKKDCLEIDIRHIEKLPMHELIRKLNDSKECVGSSSKNQAHRMAFGGLLSFGELHVAPMFELNLKGLSATAAEDENIMACLDEIALLNNWGDKCAPPEARLMFGLAMLSYKVNAYNKNKEKTFKMPLNDEEHEGL